MLLTQGVCSFTNHRVGQHILTKNLKALSLQVFKLYVSQPLFFQVMWTSNSRLRGRLLCSIGSWKSHIGWKISVKWGDPYNALRFWVKRCDVQPHVYGFSLLNMDDPPNTPQDKIVVLKLIVTKRINFLYRNSSLQWCSRGVFYWYREVTIESTVEERVTENGYGGESFKSHGIDERSPPYRANWLVRWWSMNLSGCSWVSTN